MEQKKDLCFFTASLQTVGCSESSCCVSEITLAFNLTKSLSMKRGSFNWQAASTDVGTSYTVCFLFNGEGFAVYACVRLRHLEGLVTHADDIDWLCVGEFLWQLGDIYCVCGQLILWDLFGSCMMCTSVYVCVYVCWISIKEFATEDTSHPQMTEREFAWDVLCMGSNIQRRLKPVTNTDGGIGSGYCFVEHSIDKLDPWKRTNLSSANQCKSMIYLITWSTVHCRSLLKGMAT